MITARYLTTRLSFALFSLQQLFFQIFDEATSDLHLVMWLSAIVKQVDETLDFCPHHFVFVLLFRIAVA
jgi:hypothetical protein